MIAVLNFIISEVQDSIGFTFIKPSFSAFVFAAAGYCYSSTEKTILYQNLNFRASRFAAQSTRELSQFKERRYVRGYQSE